MFCALCCPPLCPSCVVPSFFFTPIPLGLTPRLFQSGHHLFDHEPPIFISSSSSAHACTCVLMCVCVCTDSQIHFQNVQTLCVKASSCDICISVSIHWFLHILQPVSVQLLSILPVSVSLMCRQQITHCICK